MLRSKKILLIGALFLAAAAFLYYFQSVRVPGTWDSSGSPQTELNVLKRAIYYIQNNYVAPDKLSTRDLLKNALHIMQQGIPPAMVQWPENPKKPLIIEVAGKSRRFNIPEDLSLSELPEFLGHIVDFVQANLPEDEDDDRPEENIEYLLVGGLVSELDPHSTFLRPKIYSEFKIGTSGNFGGIGIAIGIRDGYLTVIAPLEGTPAYRAGVKAKDRIIQINDERTINMSLTEAVERLRGKIGTKVTILVRRENVPDPISFTIRRALITIDSVKAELVPGEKIALIKIKNFQEDTISEFHRSLRKLSSQAKGLDGIILDLRNNPGGLLDQSVSMADAFLADGIIVSTVGLSNQLHEEDRARGNDVYETIPLIVLVNEGSASASEILAGAVQAHGRAIILGNKTFGKGTVQTLYDLKDGSALKLTIAKYLAAGTEDVQASGIVPDVLMIPMHISEENVDIVENEARREHDLEKRIKKNDTEKPANKEAILKLPYVDPEEKEEEVTGTVKLSHDFPVELAIRILNSQQQPDRESQLKFIKGIITELEEEQAKRLAKEIKKHGIDWEKGPKQGAPKANVTHWFSSKDQKVKKLQGGEEVFLNVEVKNIGDGAFYQLMAISHSDNPLFADLEFPLGRLNPGETRKYSAKIKLPATLPSQEIPISIDFREAYDRGPAEEEFRVYVNAAPDPVFAFSWEFAPGTDGLKADKDVTLNFKVQNLGPGEAKDPVLNLSNREGSQVFLKQGRAKLEPLAAGAEQEASLIIRLKKDVPFKDARLTISIEDSETGAVLRDSLTFADQPADYSPPMGQLQKPPSITLEMPKDPYWSTKKKYRFSGTVSDDDAVKEIYVFVNFDKVYYQYVKDSKPNEPVPFSVTVPLEEGPNRINVLAKDRAGLTGRQHWIVWKPEK